MRCRLRCIFGDLAVSCIFDWHHKPPDARCPVGPRQVSVEQTSLGAEACLVRGSLGCASSHLTVSCIVLRRRRSPARPAIRGHNLSSAS